MQHLNYCRQALAQFKDSQKNGTAHHHVHSFFKMTQEESSDILDVAINMIDDSKKFIMPDNGRIIQDKMLRGINEDVGARLPYKSVCLEYLRTYKDGPITDKTIVAAHQPTETLEIYVFIFYLRSTGAIWQIYGPPLIIRADDAGFISRETGEATVFIDVKNFHESIKKQVLHDNAIADVFSVLDLVNALACKNVHVEKSPAKASKQGKKVKAALPFDDYHFLTVDVPGKAGVRGEGFGGSHRSPREHLRRGHIRRLDSGPIWVNACVVNAGIGSKVGKSYLVRKSA